MFQQLVLVLTFGLLLAAVGWTWDTWQFWSFLGLFWCSERLGRMFGRVEGIIDFVNMSEQEQQRLRRMIRDAEKEQNNV